MEFRDHKARPLAHINLPAGHTCFVRWFARSHMGPWRCPTDFAALRWHMHPVSRKEATRKARNPKGVSQREVNLKGVSQKVTNPKAMSLMAAIPMVVSLMAVSQ